MPDYRRGVITTEEFGQAKKIKYRCSRGHEFEDVSPGGPLPENIVLVTAPSSLRGNYCGQCIVELLAEKVGKVTALM